LLQTLVSIIVEKKYKVSLYVDREFTTHSVAGLLRVGMHEQLDRSQKANKNAHKL